MGDVLSSIWRCLPGSLRYSVQLPLDHLVEMKDRAVYQYSNGRRSHVPL